MSDSNTREILADASLTIPQFCDLENISIAFYYKLKHQGLGPVEMRLGRSPRITAAARRRWQQQREKKD
jgi:hypothetical protein